MKELEFMLNEGLYIASDNELKKLNLKHKRLIREFNNLTKYDNNRKQKILKELFENI